jgi:hypothetical protein
MADITHTVTVTEFIDNELSFERQYGFTNRDDAWSFFKQEEEYIIETFHVMPHHLDGQTFMFELSAAGLRQYVELEDIALAASKQRYEDSLKEFGLGVDWD